MNQSTTQALNLTQYTITDFPVGVKVQMKDEVWAVVKSSPLRDIAFLVPFNHVAKDRYISIAIEMTSSFLNQKVTGIEKQ